MQTSLISRPAVSSSTTTKGGRKKGRWLQVENSGEWPREQWGAEQLGFAHCIMIYVHTQYAYLDNA